MQGYRLFSRDPPGSLRRDAGGRWALLARWVWGKESFHFMTGRSRPENGG